jgi:ABC-2 type transport system permease protein
MSANTAVATAPFRYFRSPQTVIGRFVARRTIRSAAFLALAFGAYVASKAAGYAAAYPTAASRAKVAASLGNNIGLRVFFGAPNHISTVTGATAWNTGGVMVLIVAIWAFLLATKTLRGEENAGRWELLLTGQTTARRATINTLAGLSFGLFVLYVVSALTFIGVGKIHTVDLSTTAALFFALTVVASAAVFVSVGAFASQLMPTRSRATSLSATILGICFLLRAVAGTTNAHWLLDITPLGWIERMQPLYGSQPMWLLPVAALVLVLSLCTIFLAGHRDLGASTFVDNDMARPRTGLLNTPMGAAIRLTRVASLSWLIAIGLGSLFFGLLTKPAAQAFTDSAGIEHTINRLAHATQQTGATIFLGIVFFLLMLVIMSYAASAIGAMREEEAAGYLDNLLVRSVGRLQWLWGRLLLITVVVILASLLSSIGVWASVASQHVGVPFHTLFLAGLNMVAPALFILGAGIWALGIVPRLTTVVAYGVIGWSFLIQMISSGLNINHWILDTSVLQHIPLAPAANPNWMSAGIIAALGIVLCIVGSLVFNARDLEAE